MQSESITVTLPTEPSVGSRVKLSGAKRQNGVWVRISEHGWVPQEQVLSAPEWASYSTWRALCVQSMTDGATLELVEPEGPLTSCPSCSARLTRLELRKMVQEAEHYFDETQRYAIPKP